jgi:hypothetical protein
MCFRQRKTAACKSVIVITSCAAAYGAGCSSRVELGIDSQFNTGLGGTSLQGTGPVGSGGNSGVLNNSSDVPVNGGGSYATGGANTAGSSTTIPKATGGSTSTGQRSPGSSGNGCISVNNGYVTTSEFAGYAYTFATQSAAFGSNPVTVSPTCDTSGCTPAFSSNRVCATGVVGAASDFASLAGITFNVNQPSANDRYTSLFTTSLGSYGLMVDYTNTAGSPLRVQLNDSAWISYCYELPPASGTSYIPWTYFNTACWNGSGTSYSPSVPIVGIQMMVPGSDTVDVPFDFCLLCVQTFSGLQ